MPMFHVCTAPALSGGDRPLEEQWAAAHAIMDALVEDGHRLGGRSRQHVCHAIEADSEAASRSVRARPVGCTWRSPRPWTSSSSAQTRSITAAIAWPKPMHMQATP